MIIEALTFKLSLDFLLFLKKNRVYSTDIKVLLWDRAKYRYINFATLDELTLYFNSNYKIVDNCNLGNLCSIQFVRLSSDLFNFETGYVLSDITGNFKLTSSSQFDLERNPQRKIFKDNQIAFLNKTVQEYRSFFNEIKNIYVTGIYSPCYAEPGWSENTWYLKSIRDLIFSPNNYGFPYPTAKLKRFPPN